MKLRRICSTAKPASPSAGSALAPSPPPTICRSGVVLADRRDGRGSEMALAERGSGLASSGLAHQHGRDELGHGTHGFGFYKAGVHGFRFYRTSDLTRCENWPPDRISRSWLPLTVARAHRRDAKHYGALTVALVYASPFSINSANTKQRKCKGTASHTRSPGLVLGLLGTPSPPVQAVVPCREKFLFHCFC